MEKVKCTQCQEKGHFTRRCPKEQCPNCKQYGHWFKDCYVSDPLPLPPLSFPFQMRSGANSRMFLRAVDAIKVVIHTATVPLEAVKHVVKRHIDDMNVVRKSGSRLTLLSSDEFYLPRQNWHPFSVNGSCLKDFFLVKLGMI